MSETRLIARLIIFQLLLELKYLSHAVLRNSGKRFLVVKPPKNHNRFFAETEIVQICQPTLDGNKVDSVEFINSHWANFERDFYDPELLF